jgi:hypothetical protein
LLSVVLVTGLAVVFVGIVYLYKHIEQRGISIGGGGHIAVMPNGDVWAFFLDGGQVRVSPESAKRLGAQTGPCTRIDGALKDDTSVYDVDLLDCSPGKSVVPKVVERLQTLGLKFGYWPLEATGQTLAEAAVTPEIVGAMIDPRTEDPQLVRLYNPLFAETIPASRKGGGPPPLIIQVDRNDFVTNRLDRDKLAAFLDRPRFTLAGSGQQGGWIVRQVEVAPDGTPTLERLLVNPLADPWPNLLRAPTLRVSRRSAALASPAGGGR